MARIVEFAAGFPGYNATIPHENGFLSEILVRNGYATFAVGKWHLTPASEMTMGSPRDKWPLGRGFERFYGFMGGETDQYHPELVYDNHFVEPPRTPEEGYHLTEDLADQAILFMKDLRATAPDKPFFLWFTPGACHAPHQAPKDVHRPVPRASSTSGWDAWREQVFERQVELRAPARGHPAVRAPGVGAGVGLAHRRRAPPLRPDDGDLRRLPHPHRRPGAAGARLHRRARRGATTRS